MAQKYLNNFETQFVASVKDTATTGTPATELDYGIVRVAQGAGTILGALTGGDYYMLTAYKKSGSTESNIEVMKVTVVDTSYPNETRLTVLRAQEGTTAQAYVSGDYMQLRWTKGAADNTMQKAENLSGLADVAAARTNLGLGTAATQASTAFAAASHTQAWSTITSTPTTLAGYGISDALTLGSSAGAALSGSGSAGVASTAARSDHIHPYPTPAQIGAQPVDADLTAIAALAGTSGFLTKTGADTWALDTSTYITGNQTITVSGDASGSGTTAITLTLATVPVAKGGTGATDAATARTNLGAAPLASPTFTGLVTSPAGSASQAGGLKLTSGTLKTSPVAGDSGGIEYDGSSLYVINSGGSRKTLAYLDSNITGNAATATTATHVTGGAVGAIPYQTSANTTTMLTGNTLASKRFLTQTGNGSTSAAPSWGTIVDGDLPSALTGKTYNALTLTAAATGFTVAGGTTSKTLTISNTLTLSGTDSSTLNIGAGGTLGSAAFTASTAYEPAITTLSVSKGGTGVGTLTGLVKGNGTSAFTAAVAGTDFPGLSSANTFSSNQTLQANLIFDGTSRRITGDMSNATLASRLFFQSSTTNGNSTVSVMPNGTGTAGQFAAYAGSDPANSAFGALLAGSTAMQLISNKTGTASTQPLQVLTDGTTRATFGAAGALDLATGLREARVTMAANDVNLRDGNYFTKTLTAGSVTLTVSNVPAAGTVASFILDLTNGGLATITWFTGIKWAGGSGPALSSAGRDVLGFFSHDGGTTWNGLLLGKDLK